MVESIMHSFLSTLAPGLRIHQLGVRRILLLFNLAPDLLVSKMLAQKEGLLVRQELIFCAALFSLLFKPLRLKPAILVLGLGLLLHALLLELALAVQFPVVHPLHIFERGLLSLDFLL